MRARGLRHSAERCFAEKVEAGSEGNLCHFHMLRNSVTEWDDTHAAWRTSEFCKCLSPEAILEFESLAAPFWCEENTVLLTEGEKPGRALFLLQGRAKLSMNSIEGRRLILGVAAPGDFLGLGTVVSGLPCEVIASTTAFSRLPFPSPSCMAERRMPNGPLLQAGVRPDAPPWLSIEREGKAGLAIA